MSTNPILNIICSADDNNTISEEMELINYITMEADEVSYYNQLNSICDGCGHWSEDCTC